MQTRGPGAICRFGALRASGFRCIKPDGRTWNEDKLFLQFAAEGQLRQNLVQRIEKAQLTMDADSERMEAQLTQPVDEPLKSAWPLACSWSGELGHWRCAWSRFSASKVGTLRAWARWRSRCGPRRKNWTSNKPRPTSRNFKPGDTAGTSSNPR